MKTLLALFALLLAFAASAVDYTLTVTVPVDRAISLTNTVALLNSNGGNWTVESYLRAGLTNQVRAAHQRRINADLQRVVIAFPTLTPAQRAAVTNALP